MTITIQTADKEALAKVLNLLNPDYSRQGIKKGYKFLY